MAGECGAVSRKKGAPQLHLRGVALHRIVPGFLCQGGDITHDRDGTGLGGASVYGGTFEDEGFPLKHQGRGELLMANAGRPGNNHSQFAITMARIKEFESGHVIFGRVLDGFEVLRLAELEGTSAEGYTERPVVSYDCGELDARGEAIEVVSGYVSVFIYLTRASKIGGVVGSRAIEARRISPLRLRKKLNSESE